MRSTDIALFCETEPYETESAPASEGGATSAAGSAVSTSVMATAIEAAVSTVEPGVADSVMSAVMRWTMVLMRTSAGIQEDSIGSGIQRR
jgi:hypothetical protein